MLGKWLLWSISLYLVSIIYQLNILTVNSFQKWNQKIWWMQELYYLTYLFNAVRFKVELHPSFKIRVKILCLGCTCTMHLWQTYVVVTLPDSLKPGYELLCKDNTRAPIDSYKSCHLAKVPAHAVITRKDAQLASFIWKSLSEVQVNERVINKSQNREYWLPDETKRAKSCSESQLTKGQRNFNMLSHTVLTAFMTWLPRCFFRASGSSLLKPTPLPRIWCSRIQPRGWCRFPKAQTPSCIWVLNTWVSSVPSKKVRARWT